MAGAIIILGGVGVFSVCAVIFLFKATRIPDPVAEAEYWRARAEHIKQFGYPDPVDERIEC